MKVTEAKLEQALTTLFTNEGYPYFTGDVVGRGGFLKGLIQNNE